MTFIQAVGLLFSGGILTAAGSIIATIFQNRSEEKRATRKREEDIADRNFNLKKDAYFEALKEFNLSGVIKFHGIGNYALSQEELARRNSAMTLFDMYATEEIKSKAVNCIRLFQIPIPNEDNEKEQLNTQVLDALRELSEAVRRDLQLD